MGAYLNSGVAIVIYNLTIYYLQFVYFLVRLCKFTKTLCNCKTFGAFSSQNLIFELFLLLFISPYNPISICKMASSGLITGGEEEPLRLPQKSHYRAHLCSGEYLGFLLIPFGLHGLPHPSRLMHLLAEEE